MGTTAAQLETEAAIWRSLALSQLDQRAKRLQRAIATARAAGKPDAAAILEERMQELEWAAMVVRRSN